jgi:hypothetical protein
MLRCPDLQRAKKFALCEMRKPTLNDLNGTSQSQPATGVHSAGIFEDPFPARRGPPSVK